VSLYLLYRERHKSVASTREGQEHARGSDPFNDSHAWEHGGDPGRVFLMGHSAGEHLAALVGTDRRYLEKVGLKLSDLSGVILLEGAGYDIPGGSGRRGCPG
jgi:hypothetical protein